MTDQKRKYILQSLLDTIAPQHLHMMNPKRYFSSKGSYAQKKLKRSGLNPIQNWPPLSLQQQRIVDAVKAGKSILITGQGGTGKSHILNYLINEVLRHQYDRTYATATTGIAAYQLNGTTIHSYAGIGLGTASVSILCKQMSMTARRRWQSTDILIIDEVSMLDKLLFDKLDAIARIIRGKPDVPWGGIQVIFAGDFLQLPPVSLPGDIRDFCFQSRTWNQMIGTHIYELHESFRQIDPLFRNALASIRKGNCDLKVMEILQPAMNRIFSLDDKIKPTKLYSKRMNVDQENAMELKKLSPPIHIYNAIDSGESIPLSQLTRSCQAVDSLTLKLGAQVMLIKNRDFTLVNGSRGVVVDFIPDFDVALDKRWPVIEFANGTRIPIKPEKFEWEQNGVIQASRIQLPLILAWAMTIHKCQGATLDRVDVHLDDSFEYGQVYVALSRVRTLDGLKITGFSPDLIRTHPIALDFYNHLIA